MTTTPAAPTQVWLDDQRSSQQKNPDGSFKSDLVPQSFAPDPPTPNGAGGSVLTTRQVNALIPKVVG